MSAAEILTNPVDARVASFVPAAQTRVLADAWSFSRWFALQCAAATDERFLVLKSRSHGALGLLAELPTHGLAALILDMRQPDHLLRDARDALVLRYLADADVTVRVMAMARERALDAERDQAEAAAGHDSMFQRLRAAIRPPADFRGAAR